MLAPSFCATPEQSRAMLWRVAFLLFLAMIALPGCGSTTSYTATDQLLMSDAVDTTIARLDFSPLHGKKVYLDATYVKTLKSPLLIDSDYVISSLRQQMVGAGLNLVESREEADLIAEARMGALGLDGHNVTYGLPASNALSGASSALTSVPLLPAIPEISFARREAKQGAAKLAVFAYDRETREPVWQSGIAKSSSSARDTWILGVGPWQRGTIYAGTRFAGDRLAGPRLLGGHSKAETEAFRASEAFAAYSQGHLFEKTNRAADLPNAESVVALASATEEASE